MAQFVVEQQPFSAGGVTIRSMVPSDGPFAGRLEVEAFRSKFEWAAGKRNYEGCVRAQGISNSSLTEEMMSRIFIAEYGGQPAGLVGIKFHGNKDFEGTEDRTCEEVGCCGTMGLCCMSCVISKENSPAGVCYIDHICVDSQFRGKGIGKLLLEKAEYEARMRQCTRMMLWVAEDNRAVHLYERQGYTVVENADGCLLTWCAVGIRNFKRMEKPL